MASNRDSRAGVGRGKRDGAYVSDPSLQSSNQEGGKAEPVENLIKQRDPGSSSPQVARREVGNVKRAAAVELGGGGGGGGSRKVWLANGVLAVVLVGAVVLGVKRIGELEARLADLGGGDASVVEGGSNVLRTEVAVLAGRADALEKKLAGLEAAVGEEGAETGDDGGVVARLEKRANLAKLADEAIAMGYRSVLRKLDSSVGEGADEELLRAANAERARVEIYYLNGAGFFPLPLPEEQDGVPAAEIGTDRLSEYLLVAESPGPLRARAAQLLGRRMETLSADALSESLVLEPDLRVLVHATQSFRRVTGCPIPSVFGGPEMREWLTGNRELVVARFKEIAEQQAAARIK